MEWISKALRFIADIAPYGTLLCMVIIMICRIKNR